MYHSRQNEGQVHVEWDDCPLADYVSNYPGRICAMRVEYTVEITPSCEAPLKNHAYDAKDWITGGAHWSNDDKEEKELKYKDEFNGVEKVDRPKRPLLKYQPFAFR